MRVVVSVRARVLAACGCWLSALVYAGCTTTPAADVCDWVRPSRGVCTRAAYPAGVNPADPGCAAAMREDQNYRPGLFSRLRRRSNYQPSLGVPPATQAPAADIR